MVKRKENIKRKSKRIPLKKKYNILHKVKERRKKKKREEKKNPKPRKSTSLVYCPNECPFKEKVIEEASAQREQLKALRVKQFHAALEKKRLEEEQAEEAKMELWRQRGLERLAGKAESGEAPPSCLDDLVKEALARQQEHEASQSSVSTAGKDAIKVGRTENSLKTYSKEFHKVIIASDVVLEIVDARDPLGTRCVQVEEAVRQLAGNKKLVVVLNKADLVPSENLQSWLQYFRRTVPAIAFKASTQKQKRNISQRVVKKRWNDVESDVSPCIGADILMSLLNNYSRNNGMKTTIHVGIVGLPNVGKSSIINSLKRSKACMVGAKPGLTRTAQLVELDKKIKLLDSPGIVFNGCARGSKNSDFDAVAVLKNAVNVHTIIDPMVPATAVLNRANKEQLKTLYSLPDFSTPDEFFLSLAEKFGRIKRGGVPDPKDAARQLLDDWNKGKIKYFTQPPETKDESHVSASIVTTPTPEFNLDSFKDLEAMVLSKIEVMRTEEPTSLNSKPFAVEPTAPVSWNTEDDNIADDDSVAEGDELTGDGKNEELVNENVTVVAQKRKKIDRGESKTTSVKQQMKEKKLMSLEGNQKLNLHKKQSFKKMKKMQARNTRHAVTLAGVLENFSIGSAREEDTNGDKGADEKYNFDVDFTS